MPKLKTMKKSIIYCLSAFLMIILLIRCNKDEVEVIKFEATTNAIESSDGTYSVDVDEAILFTDWSTGVDSRTWTFPGGTPATSTEEEVSVTFSTPSTVSCTLEVMFTDGTTNSKEFVVVVGGGAVDPSAEAFSNRDAFSFEDPAIVDQVWAKWENDGAADMTVIDTDGANGTSNSLKVSFTTAGEVQIFTNQSTLNVNASVDKTKKYIFSFWAKASETTTITAALENPEPWVSFLWQEQEIGTDWVKYSFDIDPSTREYDGTADNVYVKVKMVPENASTEIWFDEFSLREMEIGEEKYSNRDAFSFEDVAVVDQVWAKWENDGAADISVIDTDGANGTSNSLKVSFTTAGEVQIFTNQSTLDVNASVDKTKMYVFSFWAKASETTTITAALENPEPWVSFLWQDQEIGTDWVKYSFDIDPSTKDYAGTADNVYVKVKMVPENASTEIWFDEFSLKQIGFDGEVANPVSDVVNSSDKCAMSSTDGTWQQIQYFPTFTPSEGDHIFFSVYNPNNVGPGQVQFEYSSDPDSWHYAGDVSYEEGSLTGWVEYSIDLSAHVGNEINKVIIMPAGDNASAVYLDNVYFSANSLLTSADEQNIVYNDTISSGIWFQGTNGEEVANPISDAVNSSDSCAMSATDGNWQQIQYFPTFTPSEGDHIFFSVYNPNNAGPGQVQFEYSSDPNSWNYVADVSYEEGSLTGWVEYSIDLSAHAGNEINKVIIMPAGDNASAVYVDNVYFGTNTLLTVGISKPVVNDDHIYFDAYGRITFDKNQSNTELHVYDISGRLLMRETIRGNKSSGNLRKKGIYILKIKKGSSISGKKLIFN